MKVTITESEILSQQRTTLKKITYTTELPDGSRGGQIREIFEHGNAAACLLYDPAARTILLTRQFRLASYLNGNASGMLNEVPAGLLEAGEDPADTMKRELEEETGYAVDSLQPVYTAYSSPGAYTEKLHLFVAPYDRNRKAGAGGGLKEEGEDIQLVELSFTEARRQLEQGALQDAKTIILVQYALLRGLIN